MAKLFSSLIIIILCTFIQLIAGNDGREINVLSYYAVGNSLDGQLLVDVPNVLRFFPVFALRDSTYSVNVTLYYGSKISTQDATKMEEGKYWQVALPDFQLGEAIQRIEVDVQFHLNRKYRFGMDEHMESFWQQQKNNLTSKIKAHIDTIRSIVSSRPADTLGQLIVSSLKDNLGKFNVVPTSREKDIPERVAVIPSDPFQDVNLRILALDALNKTSKKNRRRHFFLTLNDSISHLTELWKVKIVDHSIATHLLTDTSYFNSIRESTNMILSQTVKPVMTTLTSLDSAVAQATSDTYDWKVNSYLSYTKYLDTISAQLAKEIEAVLLDTSFSGESVRKSDLTIDQDSLRWGRILYRNYNKTLRRMPALDPVERLGIFRIRYVPFIMTSDIERPYNLTFTPPLGINPHRYSRSE